MIKDSNELFVKIAYGELKPGVKEVKILDEPLRYPEEVTTEWRSWISSQQAKNLRLIHAHDPIENLDVTNIVIESEGYRTPARVYKPKTEGKHPVLMYIHGGAWVFCDLDTHDHDCRYFCVHADCVVISLDYQLAPEHKFPHQIKEGMAALEWILRNIDSFSGSPNEIFVGGDSAGGNITAGLCIYNRDHKRLKIAKQILIYPAIDLSGNIYYSYQRYGVGYGLDNEVDKFSRAYVKNLEDLKNPYVSPMLCQDLRDLPSAIVVLGECDILVDEGLIYAQRLRKADVEVECFVYSGMPHGFIQAAYPESYQALNAICERI